MVKHVVREILPQIVGTFNREKYEVLRINRGVHNILERAADSVLQLPKLALYQIELHPDMKFWKFLKVVKTVVKGHQPHF